MKPGRGWLFVLLCLFLAGGFMLTNLSRRAGHPAPAVAPIATLTTAPAPAALASSSSQNHLSSIPRIPPVKPVLVPSSPETKPAPLEIAGLPAPKDGTEESILKNLAPPHEPPNGMNVPTIISKDEWRGVLCGVTQPAFVVFRDADAWKDFWQKAMAPYAGVLRKTPTVDFSHNMIVGVFRGERPYPVDEIWMLWIERPIGGAGPLVVRFKDINGLRGLFTPRFAVHPFHMRRLPVFMGRIVFIKTEDR